MSQDAGVSELELTVLMPCLDEAETVGDCVKKARAWIERSGVAGEVLVADNGSTDGSVELATEAGARVVPVATRGYGAALQSGIAAARGRFVVMGDADDSYDFGDLGAFLRELRDGADLVMGNRFAGGIEPGAMPFLHRYLGNPVLSWLGRLFFRTRIGDFHCGLRGFRRDAMLALGLRTTGMEFASEMVVRSALSGLDIREVPTTLSPDGRTRAPHLRTWHDGWRHLRFLLLFSPRWLFVIPGLLLMLAGFAATTLLVVKPVTIGGIRFDVGALVYSAMATIVGMQAFLFGVFTHVYAEARGLLPPSAKVERLRTVFTLERGIAVGAVAFLFGAGAALVSLWRWRQADFGDLDPTQQLRVVVPAALGIVHGASLVLSTFTLSMLGLDQQLVADD